MLFQGIYQNYFIKAMEISRLQKHKKIAKTVIEM